LPIKSIEIIRLVSHLHTHSLEISMIHPPNFEILQTDWTIPPAHLAPFRQLTYIDI